jgi:hypothetical protein
VLSDATANPLASELARNCLDPSFTALHAMSETGIRDRVLPKTSLRTD